MIDDPHSTTVNIRKLMPHLAWMPRWLRDNFTPKVAWTVAVVVCSAAVTVSTKIIAHEVRVGMRDARMDALEESLAKLSRKVDALPIGPTAEQFAKLQSSVAYQEGRWRQVDCARGHCAKDP